VAAWVRYFDGTVDDARVYDRALSAAEVANLAVRPPRVRYDLSEGAGASTADLGTVGDTGHLDRRQPGGHTGTALTLADDVTNGDVDAAARAVHTDASFSVSAWVNLSGSAGVAGSRTAVSQAGTTVSGFFLQYRSGADRWAFVASTSDTNAGAAGSADVVTPAGRPPPTAGCTWWASTTRPRTRSSCTSTASPRGRRRTPPPGTRRASWRSRRRCWCWPYHRPGGPPRSAAGPQVPNLAG
jgi:hypothetical protein